MSSQPIRKEQDSIFTLSKGMTSISSPKEKSVLLPLIQDFNTLLTQFS